MVVKRLERLAPWSARLFYDFALLLVAVSMVFNYYAFQRLTHIASQNKQNGLVVKAATGCGDTDSIIQCKAKIGMQGQNQIATFLQQEDCWTRRALANMPPPNRYDVPCFFPKAG